MNRSNSSNVGSSQNHPDTPSSSMFIIMLGFTLFVFLVVLTIVIWKRRNVPVSRKKQSKSMEHRNHQKDAHTLYVPQYDPHPSGVHRVFITNKGIRVFDTNEYGIPISRSRALPATK